MAKYLKAMVYKTMNIPVLMFGAETWTMTRKVGGLQKRECCGGYLEPHRMIERNAVIRKTLGVACITDKIQEARLMVRSCDEKRGRKLHEKNYDGRGQQMLQKKLWET